jgi:hypothetical protein
MTENMFIIFAPWTGGNHLANIVSMSDRFGKRFNDSIYNTPVFHAHPSSKQNYAPVQSELEVAQNKSNVFCSHFTEYLTSSKLTEQYLSNRKYIVLEFPNYSRTNFFKQRVSKKSYFQDRYMIEELATLYSVETFSKLTNEQDVTQVGVDLLFDKDISNLLLKLNQEFGLNFDHDAVEHIHQSWLTKNAFR